MQTKWTIRRAEERGHSALGWLDSRHTFSFGDYHDPQFMGFRSLRVINEDRVAPGGGFPMHPHRDMEIFSYLLEGRLQHGDSMGNSRVLEPGQIQLMSAGSGVRHSEENPSDVEGTHFLQIWLRPRENGLTPGYTEWEASPELAGAEKCLVISSDGRDGSAVIHQEADIWRVRLAAGGEVTHVLGAGRGAWVQVMRGTLEVDGVLLSAGDGASTEASGEIVIRAMADSLALLFDLG